MYTLRGHNGEGVALILAALCAWAIAASVLHFDAGSPDAIHLPGIAAAAAVGSTWVFWRLLAAYGRHLTLLRGALAGGLGGIVAHPVFMFLVLVRDSIALCASSSCIADSVFSAEGLGMTAVGTAIFSVMGLVILGPLTAAVGLLGGALAVLISRSGGATEGQGGGERTEATEDGAQR